MQFQRVAPFPIPADLGDTSLVLTVVMGGCQHSLGQLVDPLINLCEYRYWNTDPLGG